MCMLQTYVQKSKFQNFKERQLIYTDRQEDIQSEGWMDRQINKIDRQKNRQTDECMNRQVD